MQFAVTLRATINPHQQTSLNGLPSFVNEATFAFAITARDFEAAFELTGELAELCPYATTVEVKQISTFDD